MLLHEETLMAGVQDLKLLGAVSGVSPYVICAQMTLSIKGLGYDYLPEDLRSKSDLLVAFNPVYKKGMLLLTLPVTVPSLKPPTCAGTDATCPRASTLQLGVYFGGLYIITLGHSGTEPNISTISADQFDDFDPAEKLHKLSFFNWWMFTIFLGILFSTTVLIYLQDNVSWSVGYGVSTLRLVVSVGVFLTGTPLYHHKVLQGSPFARMGKVFAVAVWNCDVVLPADAKELHKLEQEHYTNRRFRLDATDSMRLLNKAAVKLLDDSESASASRPGWTLCTVTQVEETKQIVKFVPLLATMVVPCTLFAQCGSAIATLDRCLGRGCSAFQMPLVSLGAFITLTMLICLVLYDRILVPAVWGRPKNPSGITLLQWIGAGMLLQVMTIVTTAVIESRRLSFARSRGLDATGGELPLTIFVQLPQFVLMGVADAFLVVGQIEFFYDQAPESTKSLGTAMGLTAYDAGNALNSAVLTPVERVTRERGSPWVTNNLNASRLDYYYAFLTALGAANLSAFVALSCKYSYRAESTETIDVAMMDVQGGTARVHSEPEPMA